MSGRYLAWGLMLDTSEQTEGDVADVRRALSRLEEEFPGLSIIGFAVTERMPVFSVNETRKPDPRSVHERRTGGEE